MSKRVKSCGSIVFIRHNEMEYLLLQTGSTSRPGSWDFSKGEVDNDETEMETALRELEEETGITDAVLKEGFREEISYFYEREGHTMFKVVVYFLFKTKQREVKLSWEHIAYAWLPYEKAMKRLTFANSRKVLKKAHEFLTQTKILPY